MEFLKKMLEAKTEKVKELRAMIQKSESLEEVRSLGKQVEALDKEITDIRNEITAREAEKNFDPVKTVATATVEPTRSENTLETMEYREAFKDYVVNGNVSPILQMRSSSGGSADLGNLGVIIPLTVMNSIMTSIAENKKYGQLYARVQKTNLKGGVKYPLGTFEASFNRITETTVSGRQHVGEITGAITFEYLIGEIRLERTLLQTVLSVPQFEQKFAETVAEAYVKAMDKEILRGDATNNEMEGILTEANKVSSRIDSSHIIEFTEEEMADWKSWRTNLYAKIPLAMRGETINYVMGVGTFEANIMTLTDDNNRPIGQQTFNPVNGAEICRFDGKEVVLVEGDQFKDFNDIESTDADKYFGMYWVPNKAYCINSNLEFSVVDYFDHETNKYVKKAIVINDGKVLNPDYIYLLKKKF